MPKKGLPNSITWSHDAHYIEELAQKSETIGNIIPIEKIKPNPDQPRTEFGNLDELADSIRRNGVLEPILVRPDKESGEYMIIAGERRWRASKLVGLTEIPCIELDVDNESVAEIALIENLQRKDLNIWETADGLANLAEKFDYTHESIAKKIGKSRTHVTEFMAIAGLPDSIRKKCRKAEIKTKNLLIEISRQIDEKEMHRFTDELISNKDRKGSFQETASGKKTSTKPAKSNKTKFRPATNVSNNFVYKSADESFQVLIDFRDLEDFNSRDILKALKEAFDSVKQAGGLGK
jgi:ParB family chromosome partitioning protein